MPKHHYILTVTAWDSGNSPRRRSESLTARSAVFLFICQNFRVMNNFKKTLDSQQKVNEAVQAIFEHFRKEINFCELFESMSNAQTAIMIMTTHYHRLLEVQHNEDSKGYQEDVTDFFYNVSEIFKLIRPLAEMAERD